MTEAALHRSVARYLSLALVPPAWFTTFPAGGGGKVRGAKLKAAGLRAGMPDLLVFAPSGKLVGLELKTPIGRLSAEQVATHVAFRACGFSAFVCRSLEDVQAALDLARIPHRAKVAA